MEIRYKLTDENGFTKNQTEWKPGVSYETDGEGELCSSSFLHCYSDPFLAVFLAPLHVEFRNPKMCVVEVDGVHKDDRGLKEGWSRMTFREWMKVPIVTTTQRSAFAILCAKEFCRKAEWNKWADRWLDGSDRRISSASSAAYSATNAAAYSAANVAAANAAYSAAAYSATNAANAAAAAAANAAAYNKIDLKSIANKAMEY